MGLAQGASGFLAGVTTFGCAAAALAGQGGRVSPLLDVLNHFAPIYLLVGVLGLTTALLLRIWSRPARMAIALAASVAIIASCTLILPEYLANERPAARAAGPSDLKIVEFNAWAGNRMPDAVVAWIRREDPDIVVLIEGGRIPEELERIGYHRRCRGCSATFVSRLPSIDSNAPGRRGIIDHPPVPTATFADLDGAFTVIAVHRKWPRDTEFNETQRLQLKVLVERYGHDRTIVVGDFNSTPWSFALRGEDKDLGLLRRTRAVFSWPAERVSHNHLPSIAPYLPIDHVYAGRSWRTVSVRRGPRLGSDHYPIIVELARVPGARRR
jgi:endonuclease/exonuclease/phosphatase (EEP) superfamily protein YafD